MIDDPTLRAISMQSRTCSTDRLRTALEGWHRLPSMYSSSWNKLGLTAPILTP